MLLVLLWTLVIAVSTIQKQRLLDDGEKELVQLTSAVAQHATGMFRNAETALRLIDHWLQANPHIDPRSDARFAAMVDELRRASGGLIDPRMVSVDGHLFYIPSDRNQPPVDVRDRPYFQAQQDKGARKLYIGDPVLSRVTGKWGLPISWRLEKPVAGIQVVFAAIELDRLGALHDQMRIKPNGTVTFVRTDGITLSRTPFDTKLIGLDVSKSPFFKSDYGLKQRGTFISDGIVTDGVPRLISYERIADYPVTVLVTRGMADLFSLYEWRKRIVLMTSAFVTLLALGFTWLMQRSQRALQGAQDELRRMEATDSLTGVMSRRAFLELAQREISRARRYGRPAAVLVLDLDHFKRVNDTHGHAVGDTVLRGCAAAWTGVLREQDVLGRTGGEEFCAVLPEMPASMAGQAAERLRAAVSRLRFQGRAGEFSVTVSIGLTLASPDDSDFAQTMERADRALYQAKALGRDRVETVDAPPAAADGAAA